MGEAWPAICTGIFLAILLVAIIRYRVNAFLALLVVSLGLGLAAGLGPGRVVAAMSTGIGDILKEVAILLALGAILGRLLEASGAAEVIAETLIRALGEKRASLACLVAAFLVGISVMFNVAFLLVVPIMNRLQRQTGRSLLWFLLPLTFSLGITHSLVPPKPGIIGAVRILGGTEADKVMVQTIVFGTLLGIPMVLVGWLGPGRRWAQSQFVEAIETPNAAVPTTGPRVSFAVAVFIVVLPLVLSLVGFAATLTGEPPPPASAPTKVSEPKVAPKSTSDATAIDWLRFFGMPTMALLVPTLLSFWLLGTRRGLDARQLEKLAGGALTEVGSMVFLFGAAGGFKEVITATGAGRVIGEYMLELPVPPLVTAYLVAVLVRIALGSATASVLTASPLLVGLSASMPGQEVFLVLAVACGVTFMTQPADSGFWLMKEFGNLSVRDVMIRLNVCKIVMSLTGLIILLVVQALLFGG